MKGLIISLIFFISLMLESSEIVPDKLIKAIDSLKNDPELYPVYKIDLIIFKNLTITESDKEEIFDGLEEFLFSMDLLKLSDTPSLLVERNSIRKGLTPNNQVIKTVDINKDEGLPLNLENKDMSLLEDEDAKPLHPSYPYFEIIESKHSQTNTLVKKLKNTKEYELIFSGGWYQPVFNKELASPVYIKYNNKKDGVRGELTIYKERFLHSLIKIRLTEKTDKFSEKSKIITNDFNELINLSKLDSKFSNFFKNIGKEASSLTNWLFKTKGFSQVTTLADPTLDLSEVYVDKFELSEELKMKENEYYFIDHPYFGIILKISLWKKRKIN